MDLGCISTFRHGRASILPQIGIQIRTSKFSTRLWRDQLNHNRPNSYSDDIWKWLFYLQTLRIWKHEVCMVHVGMRWALHSLNIFVMAAWPYPGDKVWAKLNYLTNIGFEALQLTTTKSFIFVIWQVVWNETTCLKCKNNRGWTHWLCWVPCSWSLLVYIRTPEPLSTREPVNIASCIQQLNSSQVSILHTTQNMSI